MNEVFCRKNPGLIDSLSDNTPGPPPLDEDSTVNRNNI